MNKKKSVKNDIILSKTNLGNCCKMVQKLEISFKAVKGWFPDFHSFYSFYHKYMIVNIQRFGSSKILTHFASDYWFCKISWTLYGHLWVLFVRLGICACGRRSPYIVQEINQNLITGSTEKNKQNPFLVINKCWKYGKQLYQTSLQSYIILGEVHPIIDITTVHQFMENHGINFIDINLNNVGMLPWNR